MSDPSANGPNATSDDLAGTQWEILSIDDQAVVAGEEPLLITFGHDGRVTGTTGVNHLTASYSLTNDYLTFGPLATTRRAGPPDLMDQEHRVVASLAGMCRYGLSPRALSIDGPFGRVDLVNTRPPADVPPPAPAEEGPAPGG